MAENFAVGFLLKACGGFPGGSVVKNPPASAGDAGSIPGLGRSHKLWSNLANSPQLLCSRVQETQLLSPSPAATEACVS